MGIDKNRFTNVDISIDKFLCGICEDVVSDPILTKDCEHYLCRACVTADINICPTCASIFEGYSEIGVALKRIYSKIKLRCAYRLCNEVLTIENYVEHERKCPEGFYECPQLCGFKVRLSLDEAERKHNCIEVLQNKIALMETTYADLQSRNDYLVMKNQELKIENDCLSSTAKEHKKRRVTCGLVLAKDESFYRCFTCQVKRMSVLCVDCFKNGQHDDHRYAIMKAESSTGCYCDCGDTVTFTQETAACSKHKFF